MEGFNLSNMLSIGRGYTDERKDVNQDIALIYHLSTQNLRWRSRKYFNETNFNQIERKSYFIFIEQLL